MAVDQSTGDLLVIDVESQTLSRYHEDGTPANFSALSGNVIDGAGGADATPQGEILSSFAGYSGEMQVAIDNSGEATDGDIYVTDSANKVIDIFSEEGEYLDQLTEAGLTSTPFGEACGVAVDSSGAVYVGDFEGEVHKFEPSANPPVNTDNTANFTSVTAPCSLAAGAGPTAGYIFATEYNGEGHLGKIFKVDSEGAEEGESKYEISSGNTTVNVDPGTGHVYVAKDEEVKEFDASGASSASETSAISAGSAVTGVAVNEETGDVYIARAGASHIEVYGPLPPPTHPFLETFGSVSEPSFGEAAGMAVDQSTGDLLVIDVESQTLSRYHEDGTPANFSALSGNVIDGAGGADATPQGEILSSFAGYSGEMQVAIDNSGEATDGDIYVTDSANKVIDIFSEEGEYLDQLTEAGLTSTPFGEACGVAVDSSGAVYVGDFEGEVHKFEPSANPPVNTDNTANFTSVTAPCSLAAGAGPTAGYIFATEYNGEGHLGKIFKVDSEGAEEGESKYEISSGNTTVNVDPGTGHVYVAKDEEVKEFDASGASSASETSAISAGSAVTGVAVNEETGDVYIARAGASHIEVYGPLTNEPQEFKLEIAKNGSGSGTVECEVDGGPSQPCPEAPTLYPEGAEITLSATPASGSSFAGFSGGGCSTSPCTLTLEANVSVIATFEQLPPTVSNSPVGTLTQTTAVLNGHVNNNGAGAGSACFFEVALSSDSTFSEPVAEPACSPTPVTGSANTVVTATTTGLNGATDYIYRVRATNIGGTSKAAPPEAFTTLVGPPLISGEFASAMTETTATLNARVNPSGLSTSYHFEYGTATSYDHRIPAESEIPVGSGNLPVGVTANLTGLQPGTAYNFRLVASNSSGPTLGADQEFTTLNSAGLPDNRRFELVSPPDKRPQGEIRDQLTNLFLTFQASEDGESAIFPYLDALKSDSGGDASYLAKRSESGWGSTKISPPSLLQAPTNGLLGNASPGIVSYYSPELSCGVINTFNPLTDDTPAADVELGITNLYRRNNDGSYTLITNPVPANSGIQPVDANGFPVGIVAGASSDCSRIYFASRYHYLPNPSGLYEWDEGTLRDAGELPSGAIAKESSGEGNAFTLLTGAGGDVGITATNRGRLNSVSDDGSRFFFTALSDEPGTLGKQAIFVRENGDTVLEASHKEGGTANSLGATYQGASPDGSHVFFTATYGLTSASSGGPVEDCANPDIGTVKACDLYDYEVKNPGTNLPKLTDLSADTNPADTNGAVAQGVLAVSDNGSSVYLATRGQLLPGKGKTYVQNTAGAGSANVYLAHGGQLSFVATITRADLESAVVHSGSQWSSEATPDGEHLLFASAANITGYDSGGVREAYLYSAQNGDTVCISCRRDGLPSVGDSLSKPLIPSFPQGPSRQAHVRKMSEDGSRVFFESQDVLASGAVSGKNNLYEWERGQIYFLATGAREGFLTANATQIYGASASGDDVFIHTPQRLDPRYDTDSVQDIYDIRVAGGFPDPPPPPRACDPVKDQCQGTPTPAPSASGAASEGISGPGNPPASRRCKKGKVRRHGRCAARKHHKRHRKGKHRAAKSNRGGVK
jgi:ribosomal protein L24E